jgi:hypothetical protein
MGTYRPLLEIQVQHAYYVGGGCPGLQFKPTASSLEKLRQAGGVLRATASGLLLLIDGALAASWLAGNDDVAGGLTWLMHAEDPAFWDATAALGRPRQSLLLFDAAHAVADESTGAWRLHRSPTVSELELMRPSASQDDDTIALVPSPSPPFGLVRVPFSTLRQAVASSDTTRYLIRFAPRTTVWAYCLVGHWPEPALQVVDVARDVSFEPALPRHLADGREALVFRSTRSIALQQQPSEHCQLHSRNESDFGGNSSRASRVLVKRLPAAAPRHFARDVIGGADVLVSEIFVHR